MAKKRFYQSSSNLSEQENTEQQEQGGTSVNLQTVLLGVIALALVIQVFLMLGNRGNSSTPAYIPSAGGGTASVGAQPPVSTQPSQPAAQMMPSQPATGQQQQPASTNPMTITPTQQPTQQAAPSGNNTSVNYSKTSHDFGTLSRANGPQPEHTFTVTNTGKQPLSYTNVSVDAGGTVLAYPVNPIPPGGKGEIKVRINPANTASTGQQMLRVHLDANTDPGHQHIDLSMNITE
jgi:hypothetical protein